MSNKRKTLVVPESIIAKKIKPSIGTVCDHNIGISSSSNISSQMVVPAQPSSSASSSSSSSSSSNRRPLTRWYRARRRHAFTETKTNTSNTSNTSNIIQSKKITIPGTKLTLQYPLSLSSVEEIELAFRALGGNWGLAGDAFDKSERFAVSINDIAFTYGEVLPEAVRKMMDGWHLAASRASTLVDLGAGKCRLALQAFLEHRSLLSVIAVEYSKSRYNCARNLLLSLAQSNSALMSFEDLTKTTCRLNISEETIKPVRSLELRNDDLFNCLETFSADIVVCETAIPALRLPEFTLYLARMKSSARLLLYENLTKMVGTTQIVRIPLKMKNLNTMRVDILKTINAKKMVVGSFQEILLRRSYRTSWSSGHLFDIWIKI